LRIRIIEGVLIGIFSNSLAASLGAEKVHVVGEVRDAAANVLVASRIYIQGIDKTWHFPISSKPHDVVRYERENYWDKTQVEKHATIVAAPFHADLPAGKYTVVVERGKEYLPLKSKLMVDDTHSLRWTPKTGQPDKV
jgi:hypothetical protein